VIKVKAAMTRAQERMSDRAVRVTRQGKANLGFLFFS